MASQIPEEALRESLGKSDDYKDVGIITKFLKFLLGVWAKELNAREDYVMRSVQGKLNSATQKQAESCLRPFFRKLQKRTNDAYLQMAIGNAPWPIGVTIVGVHAGTSKDFLQTRALSEENLEPLRENHNASISQLELRIKELEFELSRMETSQDCKLEKYKQLYLEEIEGRKSLTTKLNKTALHLACACGHPAVVSLLADSKCLLNLCDLDNKTPLIKAVQCQQEECVAALLDRGADLNVTDIDGNTALYHAVLGESVAILAKLLLCNANMEVRNTDDLTPLSLAESEQKEQMMALLVKKGTEFEKMNRMDRPTSHDKGFKDTVISQACSPTEKTPENQSKEIQLPLVYLEKMSQESEINRECDRDDISTYSGHPSVQTFVEGWIKQDKSEQRKNLQLIPNELKQNFGEICENYKSTACPEEKPLHDNSKEVTSLRQIPSNMTNNTPDCEEKDAFGMSVSAGFQTFPERKVPTLRYVFSSNSDSGPLDDASWSFSKHCLNEKKLHSENDHKPDTEQDFNQKEETFYKREERKVRKSVVRFEVKEDQEFDMRMKKNLNPDTTNWKSGIGHTSESSDSQSHFDLPLAHCNQIKHTIQMRRHGIAAVTNTHTHKKTKPKPDLLQKPLYVDIHSAGNCKSMETEFEDASSCPPDSDRTPHVYVNEELQQDMHRCKNDIDMFKRELLALKKEKVQVQKEIEEERKRQKVSKMKVTKKIHKAAGEDGNGLIKPRDCKRTDNLPFPLMENNNSDRTSEEICYEDYKVKEKINSMDDLDDLTQSTETVSEPYSNCKNFVLLIKELCKDCKDPHSLYKIQGAVLSYERSMERGKNQRELLTKQVKIMEKSVRRLQRKLSETREIKSQLEHQKVELEGELCNLRFTLQEEKEKRQKADLLSKEIKEQLIKKEEEFIKETEKNRELETTVRTLELKLKILLENSYQNDYLRAKLEAVSSKCLHLEVEKKSLQQELLSMKAIETQCEKLEDEKEKWKEKVVNLRRQMEMNMVEHSALEHYKQTEKRARQEAAEKLQQVQSLMQTHRESQDHNSSIQRHLELRNRDLESELFKMQTSLFFNNMKLDKYMALYQEESEGRKLLESKLNQTMEKVEQVNTELLRQKEKNRDLLSTIPTRPVLQTPCAVNTNTYASFLPSTQRTPRKKATFPTLEEMNKQEFDKVVKKALREEAAESAYEYRRAHPVRSTDQSKSYDELFLEAKQEYTECLIKQYMPRLIALTS